MHPAAVHPLISTVRCAYNSFSFNALILGHGDGTFVRSIEYTVEYLVPAAGPLRFTKENVF